MPKENSKKKKRIQLFIKASRSGKDKYVPVVFDETDGNLYIDRKSFDYYRAQISRQKPVILYNLKSHSNYTLVILFTSV